MIHLFSGHYGVSYSIIISRYDSQEQIPFHHYFFRHDFMQLQTGRT